MLADGRVQDTLVLANEKIVLRLNMKLTGALRFHWIPFNRPRPEKGKTTAKDTPTDPPANLPDQDTNTILKYSLPITIKFTYYRFHPKETATFVDKSMGAESPDKRGQAYRH